MTTTNDLLDAAIRLEARAIEFKEKLAKPSENEDVLSAVTRMCSDIRGRLEGRGWEDGVNRAVDVIDRVMVSAQAKLERSIEAKLKAIPEVETTLKTHIDQAVRGVIASLESHIDERLDEWIKGFDQSIAQLIETLKQELYYSRKPTKKSRKPAVVKKTKKK